jgi:CDP-glucose 4,6-dehydratase
MNKKKEFWRDKRVLITGHTGFKGTWLSIVLNKFGANLLGVSLPPEKPSLFELCNYEKKLKHYNCDIRDKKKLQEIIEQFNPEIVFHLAAQSLVRRSYIDPTETYSINIQGTVNLLTILTKIESVKSILIATTDKVYKNNETGQAFVEDCALGGHDPYSSSKAALEIVVDSYRKSFFQLRGVGVVTVRAGNVIGGGDWAENRLIPDLVRAISAGKTLSIRSGNSVRPWQHVLDCLNAYLTITRGSFIGKNVGGSYNVGPNEDQTATVLDIVDKIKTFDFIGKLDYKIETEENIFLESTILRLNNEKIKKELGVTPHWNLNKTLDATIDWYVRQNKGEAPEDLCLSDIDNFKFN